MRISQLAVTPLLVLLLGACQTSRVQPDASKPQPSLPILAGELRQTMERDLLYHYLVGEIGARDGQLKTALSHYMLILQEKAEPYAAERATRIALHLKDYQMGLQAVRGWLDVAPADPLAHQFAAILHLRTGQMAQAQTQFETLLALIGGADQHNLLLVADALKKEPDKTVVLQLMRNMRLDQQQNPYAHYAVGLVEANQKLYDIAEQSLRRAITLKANWPLPHILLGQVLSAQGKRQQALEHLRNSVQTHPDDSALRHAYARQLIETEQFAEALLEFRQLREQNPEATEISYALAILATQEASWEEARSLWQALRGESEFYRDATYFLARVEESTGNTALAIGLYHSVAPGERHIDAMIRASYLLAETDRLPQARRQLRQLRSTHPKEAVDIYLAEAQMLIEQAQDAKTVVALYTQALKDFPENNALQYSRGLYLADQAQYEPMEADFLAVLSRDNQHAETLNALGYTLADRNVRLPEALQYIQRALALRPEDPAILDSMGWIQYRMGNLVQAVAYLRRALAHTPDEEIAAHLGEVLWVQGQYAEARKVWEKALERKPDSEQVKATLQRLGVSR